MRKYSTIFLTLALLILINVLLVQTPNVMAWVQSTEEGANWRSTSFKASNTSVQIELTDTIINKMTGERDYWFDTVLNGFETSDNAYEVRLNFTLEPNALTNTIRAPSLASAKLNTFNKDYNFNNKPLTFDNLQRAVVEVNNVPLTVFQGSVIKREVFSVNNTYTLDVELVNVAAGLRQARFKMGYDSFYWTVNSGQNWIDNTWSIENIRIQDGALILDNENVGGDDWWRNDFDYRIPITLGARPDNYQVFIPWVNNGNQEFDNFQDLAFVDNLGQGDQTASVLPHWIESSTLAGNNSARSYSAQENDDGENNWIEMNGVNAYFSQNNSCLAYPFTISLWSKWDGSGGSNDFFGAEDGVTEAEFQLNGGDSNYSIKTWRAGVGSVGLTNVGTAVPDVWTHLVAIIDEGITENAHYYFYQDGGLIDDGENDFYGTCINYAIGAENNEGVTRRFFGGALDDIRLYNRALTGAEVSTLSNSARDANVVTDGLVNWWTCDDIGGDNLMLDHAENAGNGARVWVRVPENADSTIYAYYGNASAPDNQSVTGVWGYDAGFDSATGWTEADPNSHLEINATDNSRIDFNGLHSDETAFIYTSEPAESSWKLDFTINFTASGEYSPSLGLSNTPGQKCGGASTDNAAYGVWYQTSQSTVATSIAGAYHFGGLTAFSLDTTYYGTITKIGTSSVTNFMWVTPLRQGAPPITAVQNAFVPPTPMGNIYAVSAWNAAGSSANNSGWVDTVLFREYILTEPSISFGAEQTPMGNYALTGEWVSRNWDLGLYSSVENLTLELSSDLMETIILESDNGTNPSGIDFQDLPPYYVQSPLTDYWWVSDLYDNILNQYTYDWSIGSPVALGNKGIYGGFCAKTYLTANFYICDIEHLHIDNYLLGSWGAPQDSFTILTPASFFYDIETDYYGENGYYLLDYLIDNVFLFNNQMVYAGETWNIGFNFSTGFDYDGDYWWITELGTDRVYRFDPTFSNKVCFKSIGADDDAPEDVYSDNENIYVVGRLTNSIYKYSLDNTHDNIYARIGSDTDNDNAIDVYTDWTLMPENGYWTNPDIADGYNWNVSFRLETDNNTRTPKIGSFTLTMDFHKEWINVENWINDIIIYERTWNNANTWNNRISISDYGAPLVPLDDAINLLILPLIILFAPALVLMKDFGLVGFIAGMILGVMVAYLALGFSLGLVILILFGIIILWWKHEG